MKHLVLLGDSVFDNKTYVGSEPSVIEHLRNLIPTGWAATLCAVDGDTTTGIRRQVRTVPTTATDLFLSVGGNDALMHIHLLSEMSTPGPLLLKEISRIAEEFRESYGYAINSICRLNKPTCVCTIYNGNLEPSIAPAAKTAVAVFNDMIYSAANERELAVIELRGICNEASDYANPIEPSGSGGLKIAKAIYEKATRRKHL
jgi:hypothetical protein